MRKNEFYTHADGLGDTDEAAVLVTPSGAGTRQAEASPWYETLIKTAVPALTTAYQQTQLTKMNLARINSGQPPITAAQFAATYQPPSAQVQFGVTSQAQKLLMYGAIAGLALVGLRAAKII